ncbi:hypothetical protein N7U66_06860 [Lacinutrix neustonica]|uniref:Lipoprotein n=1 Tax=Lacinutrix neustonica TaxID=2980107 RepID=A0A9E8MYL2_9FLAO|nr:hypothetical protein [Lacinutrix neustonica]WAC03279.1 hypothetical protein N7U66_06860 [Lacinutrix neustonica]
MKNPFKLFTFLFLVTVSSCDTTGKIDYKFAESPEIIACDLPNNALYNEAIHSFENDLLNTYDNKSKSGQKAYFSFINFTMRGGLKVEDIASAHSLKIAHLLKEDNTLWTTINGKTSLNYSHPLIDCLTKNIKTNSLKQTINALLTTNSMRPNLVLAPLSNSTKGIQGDGSLKGYVAFDFFYSKLLDSKLEDLKNPNPEPIEAAKTDVKTGLNPAKKTTIPTDKVMEKDPHAGHNH